MIKKRDLSVSEYITNALFELMEGKPYSQISITEITSKADVHRVSFYRCFSSKEEIITKWIRKTTDDFLGNSNISYTTDCLEDYFLKLFTHLENYKNRSKLINQANQIHLLKNEFDYVFMKSYKQNYDSYKSYFISGGIFNIYYYWLINDFKESAKELSLKLVDLLTK